MWCDKIHIKVTIMYIRTVFGAGRPSFEKSPYWLPENRLSSARRRLFYIIISAHGNADQETRVLEVHTRLRNRCIDSTEQLYTIAKSSTISAMTFVFCSYIIMAVIYYTICLSRLYNNRLLSHVFIINLFDLLDCILQPPFSIFRVRTC